MDNSTDTKIIKASLLSEFFEKRIKTFFIHFENTIDQSGVEDIHQMRVEVKKLRAFFRMLELATDRLYQKKSHFKLLAKIFQPGGRLRETQINLSLIEKYTSYLIPYYKVYLIEREAKQTEKLKIAMNEFDRIELENLNVQMLHFLEEVELFTFAEKVKNFVLQELKTIKSLRPDISNNKILHKIRMHLKAMGYMTKLLNELRPDQKLVALHAATKPTETLIGNWHDRIVLALSLERFLHRNKDNPNKNEITRLIAQIEKKNTEAVEEIGLRVDELLQSEI